MGVCVLRARATGVCEGVGQVFKVAADEREQVGVDYGGGGALILAVFGQYVAAERDCEVGTGVAQDVGGAAFMLGIAEAVEKTDGETLGGGCGDLGGCAGEGILVERGEDAAVYVKPLSPLRNEDRTPPVDEGAAGGGRKDWAGSGVRFR